MGIGASILLLAVGAILAFAVHGSELFTVGSTSISLDTVGYILMALGVIGLIMTMMVWGPRSRAGRDTIIERDREVL